VLLLTVKSFFTEQNKCRLLTHAPGKTYTLLHLFTEYTAKDCSLRVVVKYDIGIQLQPFVSLVVEA